jgi:hypothetical protein
MWEVRVTHPYETGDYIDLVGRKWFCVAETKKKRMVCESYDGYFTVAGYSTFAVWGWKPVVAPAHQQVTKDTEASQS